MQYEIDLIVGSQRSLAAEVYMYRSVCYLIILALVFVSLTPAYAQRSLRTAPPAEEAAPRSLDPVGRVEQMQSETTAFGEAHAYTDGRGVVVRWKMATETDNVGFNVYKVAGRGLALVNDSLIPGSKAHYGDQTAYGEAYFYFDGDGQPGDLYVVAYPKANGRFVYSNKIGVEYTDDLERSAGISFERLVSREESRHAELSASDLILPRDIDKEFLTYRRSPEFSSQKMVASQGGAKLGIRADGFYRVTKAELQAAGFPVNSDPNTWQLYRDGVEQSIIVAPNGDYIEFLGKAHETVESDLRYYFLVSGAVSGKRMDSVISHPVGGTVISPNYQQTFFAKQRTNYVNDILNGDAENYWGAIVTTSPVSYNFNLSGIDTSVASATVTINLQGFSTTAHTMTLSVNGQSLPAATGVGMSPFSTMATIPTSVLHEGSNTLQMASSAGSDYSLFDSISVSFNRKFQADSNQLSFYTLNYRGARVTGFSSPDVRLFDTTHDGDPIQVVNLNIVANGPKFDLVLPANRGRVLYAVENSAVKSVAQVVADNPSNLASSAHNANLVIIAYGNFMAQAQTWAQYRQQQGFSVEVVDIADVFDEFNFGQSSSASINAFLQYAVNNWQTPPQYVLLLGDASFDPKNYEGQGYQNLIPTKIVNTVYSETGSDDALADFNGDGLADISIGRIPAQSGQVILNALAKVQAFETPAMQNLNRGAIFAYDGQNGYDFQGMSATLRGYLPANIPAAMVDRMAANSSSTLLNEINNGRYIVNYSGHGSFGIWGSSSFFSSLMVANLTNASNQSIFTMLTCLNGYFIHPYADSLSEYLLKGQNGGAVATWASTGLTTPDVQGVMGNRFYGQIAAGNITRIGDLVRDAKSVLTANADVRYSWVLLGDPMLKVR